jgi:hypothetical protein
MSLDSGGLCGTKAASAFRLEEEVEKPDKLLGGGFARRTGLELTPPADRAEH